MPKGVYPRRDSKPERDLDIAARIMLGESLSVLARQYGLSRVRVLKINQRMLRTQFVACVQAMLKRKRA